MGAEAHVVKMRSYFVFVDFMKMGFARSRNQSVFSALMGFLNFLFMASSLAANVKIQKFGVGQARSANV